MNEINSELDAQKVEIDTLMYENTELRNKLDIYKGIG